MKTRRILPVILGLSLISLTPLQATGTESDTPDSERAINLAGETEPTTISSDMLELVSENAINRFVFQGNVTIRGTDLYASCNEMVVTTTRRPPPPPADPPSDQDQVDDENGFGEFGAITSIVAIGDVRIRQGEREATAGRATILPIEGKVVLEEKPVIRDPRGVLTGYRMILIEGERRVRIESGPDGDRTRAILPDIRDLGMDRPRIDSTSDSVSADP